MRRVVWPNHQHNHRCAQEPNLVAAIVAKQVVLWDTVKNSAGLSALEVVAGLPRTSLCCAVLCCAVM
jgi:hypothetical protein